MVHSGEAFFDTAQRPGPANRLMAGLTRGLQPGRGLVTGKGRMDPCRASHQDGVICVGGHGEAGQPMAGDWKGWEVARDTVRSMNEATLEPRPHSPGESPRRGGGPPLSVGPVGSAERLLTVLQVPWPSPRTKRCGRRCHLFPAPLSIWGSISHRVVRIRSYGGGGGG